MMHGQKNIKFWNFVFGW